MDIIVNSAGLYNNLDEDTTYRMFAEAGFDGIDWNMPIKTGWQRDNILKGDLNIKSAFDMDEKALFEFYQPQIKAMKKYGLKLSQAHSQFPAYVPGHPEFIEYNINILKKVIHICDKLEIKNLVIHGIGRCFNDPTMDPDYCFDLNCRLYEPLIETIKNTGVTVCLENLFARNKRSMYQGICSDPQEAIMYIDRFNSLAGKECFGFCFDTGHNNLTGRAPSEFIVPIGSRLKTLHVHDNWGDDDSHLIPYAGNIVWKDFTDALKKVNYQGDMSFEIQNQITMKLGIDLDAVPVLLKAIHDMGEVFIKRLEA